MIMQQAEKALSDIAKNISADYIIFLEDKVDGEKAFGVSDSISKESLEFVKLEIENILKTKE